MYMGPVVPSLHFLVSNSAYYNNLPTAIAQVRIDAAVDVPVDA